MLFKKIVQTCKYCSTCQHVLSSVVEDEITLSNSVSTKVLKTLGKHLVKNTQTSQSLTSYHIG